MLNKELPFRYPVKEYTMRVQGNVTLRLYVDTAGRVIPDSTRVLESSGTRALDVAALKGANALHFQPARTKGVPVAVSMLFPVQFRHPDVASPQPAAGIVRKDEIPRDSGTRR